MFAFDTLLFSFFLPIFVDLIINKNFEINIPLERKKERGVLREKKIRMIRTKK